MTEYPILRGTKDVIIRITVKKVTKFNYFIHGYLFHWAITSLIHDSMGKDAYIENVQSNWIDGSVTIPLAIGVLVFVFIDTIFKIRRTTAST